MLLIGALTQLLLCESCMYLVFFPLVFLGLRLPSHPPLFSLSPWNDHLRLFAISGMSETQQCSHRDEGEEGEETELSRRKRGECYSKSPPKAKRKGTRSLERTVWVTLKRPINELTGKKCIFCYVRYRTDLQPDLWNVLVCSNE